MSRTHLLNTIWTGLVRPTSSTNQISQLIQRNHGLAALQRPTRRAQSTLNQSDDFSVVSTTTPAGEISGADRSLQDDDLPLIINRTLKYPEMFNPKLTVPREAWVEDFSGPRPRKLAIVKLHPKVFGQFPRPDTVKRNLEWQNNLHWVNFLSVKVRNELSGSTKKPWPQKGQGRARHGSKRGPQWKQGGWVKGPRGPMTKYHYLHYFDRVRGLCVMLTAKLAQNDLKIVKDLESFESDDPKELEHALAERAWGPSTLLVDTADVFPKNIALAAHTLGHVNLLPVYGLNVHSMIKHETLVLTVNALNDLENKLLYAFNRTDIRNLIYKHEPPKIVPDETPEFEGARWVANMNTTEWI